MPTRRSAALLAVAPVLCCLVLGCASGARGVARPSSTDDVDIGYGTQARSRVTSPITTIRPTPTERASVGRVEELLMGRAPGVEVHRTATGGWAVRIRGATLSGGDPLFVIDGIPLPPSVPSELILSGINPADVRRIDVLRGSSGSVYGLRGGNGVILIDRRPSADDPRP